MSAALELANNNFEIHIFEKNSSLGGRAGSFNIDGEVFDTGQHILLGCCKSLLRFLKKLHSGKFVKFYSSYHFLDNNGRKYSLSPSLFIPPPFHYLLSFAMFNALSMKERLHTMKMFDVIRKIPPTRFVEYKDVFFSDWLENNFVTKNEITNIWYPLLTGTLNARLDMISTADALFVIKEGFFTEFKSAFMGTANVPLVMLYDPIKDMNNIHIHFLSNIKEFSKEDNSILMSNNQRFIADAFIFAIPPWNLKHISGCNYFLNDVSILDKFKSSSITSVHLEVPGKYVRNDAICLLGGKIHWVFRKGKAHSKLGLRLQCVISASKDFEKMTQACLIDIAVNDLARYFRINKGFTPYSGRVTRIKNATFILSPEIYGNRPPTKTQLDNVYLAGDWTSTGWPSTMESAVRSGVNASESVIDSFS